MTSPWHDIEGKAEAAVSGWIVSCLGTALTGWRVSTGFSATVPAPPEVAIVAMEDEPQIEGNRPDGNHIVSVDVIVRTHLQDDTAATHRDMVARVRDALWPDTPLATFLNFVAGRTWTVFRAEPGASVRSVEGDRDLVATTTMSVRLYMAPSVL